MKTSVGTRESAVKDDRNRKQASSPSHGLFTVGGMMRRIRLEAFARSRAGDSSTLASDTDDLFGVPSWTSAESHVAIKPYYELADLLRSSDADFVRTAYQTVLRRPADVSGLENFVSQLRSDRMDKIDVLAELRWSEEGVRQGVHINGLLLPHLIRKWGRKRVVGPLVRWADAFSKMHLMERKLQQSENVLARDLQDLGRHVGVLGDKFGATLERQDDMLAILREQVQVLRHDTHRIVEMSRRVQGIERAVDALAGESASRAESQAKVDRAHQERFRDQEKRLEAIQLRVARHDARQAAEESKALEAGRRSRRSEEVYADFEEEFRGSRELIRARLEPYVDMLRDAGLGSQGDLVMDLGSGRGEWLQILGDAGISARGIDTNPDFITFCRELSLDVEHADALGALGKQAPGSLGAVTTMHLVEHIPFEDVVALIDGSLRALKSGGILIIETPNPENLRVATHNFYLDPTHRNPLPPIMLRWLVENRGFKDVTIQRLTEHRSQPHLPRLPESSEAATSLNALVEWAEAAPDYAIVARKRSD